MKKRKRKKAREHLQTLQVAVVKWEDSSSPRTSWLYDHEHEEYDGLIIRSAGFLTYDGEEGVVITQSLSDSNASGQMLTIPRGCIRSIARTSRYIVHRPDRRKGKK